MADITWADVEALAPELSTVPQARQDFILARVNGELSTAVWGSRINIGRTYLAAHLATRSASGGTPTAGPVTSESVGSVSRSYGSPAGTTAGGFESTAYGEEYARMISQLPGARIALAPPNGYP